MVEKIESVLISFSSAGYFDLGCLDKKLTKVVDDLEFLSREDVRTPYLYGEKSLKIDQRKIEAMLGYKNNNYTITDFVGGPGAMLMVGRKTFTAEELQRLRGELD
jgi:hypothetical protein|tara:strand:+ start:530 stop:844 length:315 start_codon:yes stop_codon:yes gene_type:complete